MKVLSVALLVTSATAVACAGNRPPALGPEQQRIERLAARIRPVVPSKAYLDAFAVGDCDPSDHPGLSIYLLEKHDEAVPPHVGYLQVSVYWDQGDPLLAHQLIDWQQSERRWGGAKLCANDSCAAMTSGRVRFDVLKPKFVDGEVDLHFPGDVAVRTRFHARWIRRAICG
jgi:hypothetical protein